MRRVMLRRAVIVSLGDVSERGGENVFRRAVFYAGPATALVAFACARTRSASGLVDPHVPGKKDGFSEFFAGGLSHSAPISSADESDGGGDGRIDLGAREGCIQGAPGSLGFRRFR
jgi:hypothetical protein